MGGVSAWVSSWAAGFLQPPKTFQRMAWSVLPLTPMQLDYRGIRSRSCSRSSSLELLGTWLDALRHNSHLTNNAITKKYSDVVGEIVVRRR